MNASRASLTGLENDRCVQQHEVEIPHEGCGDYAEQRSAGIAVAAVCKAWVATDCCGEELEFLEALMEYLASKAFGVKWVLRVRDRIRQFNGRGCTAEDFDEWMLGMFKEQ